MKRAATVARSSTTDWWMRFGVQRTAIRTTHLYGCLSFNPALSNLVRRHSSTRQDTFLNHSSTISFVRSLSNMLANNPNGSIVSIDSVISSTKERTFADAMQVLRRLQSNRAAIQSSTLSSELKQRQKLNSNRQMLTRLQITADDIRRMNVVHVAGTKGKGSTCAMVESVLRNEGYRTGLFTSPHLTTVRERIRLNGQPISESLFSRYFWQVYDRLDEKDVYRPDTPLFYFGFITMMALHVFKCERVDAAIVEVGIGGEYDTTNVIDYPLVTAVTSLGLDHTQMLGNTLDQIAWHKSGIFRPNVPAFTAQNQAPKALQVLRDRAVERKCSLWIAPAFDQYSCNDQERLELGLKGPVQKMNASLALQLCRFFVNKVGCTDATKQPICQSNEMVTIGAEASPFQLTETEVNGLRSCRWPGRFECKQIRPGFRLFADGAHTPESIAHCADWFDDQTNSEYNSTRKVKRVLVFFCTGDRRPSTLLPALSALRFDTVHFTPHPLTEDLLWDGMLESVAEMQSVYGQLDPKAQVTTHSCLNDCFSTVMMQQQTNQANPINTRVDLLVTGSLYLVGNWYKLMNECSEF